VFSEGAEPKIVRAWSADITVTKLRVGRTTNRAKNMTSRLGLGVQSASYPMDTGSLSRGTESAHICYNDQDTAIISLKASLLSLKQFFQPAVRVRVVYEVISQFLPS
jgi:hypothetical protein